MRVYGLNAGSWFEDGENWVRLIFVAWMLLMGGYFIRSYTLQATCLRAGYPDTRMTLTARYCVKRMDQTDVVIPVEQVRP